MKSETPEWKLDCFSWLAPSKWSVETTMNSMEVDGKRYCKICDKYVARKDCESHVKHHVAEIARIHKIRRIEAEVRRLEAMAFAREEKKQERAAMKMLGLK